MDKHMWKRFEVVPDIDNEQLEAVEAVLDAKQISRQELALILLTLRVRPEFDLKDFEV